MWLYNKCQNKRQKVEMEAKFLHNNSNVSLGPKGSTYEFNLLLHNKRILQFSNKEIN